MNRIYFSILISLFSAFISFGQQITYTEPDREDLRQTNFEIIGRVSGNYLIYKNNRNSQAISVYDADMNQLERVSLKSMPERIINADFITYPDFFYMIYQYQRRNVVYCMADKFDGNGHKMAETVQLDTTSINFLANNKIYSLINSDDKQQIMVFKINSKNERRHLLTTALFNKELQLQQKDYLPVDMPDNNDILTEFHVDNEGNLIFTRAVQNQNDVIQKLFVLNKAANSSTLQSAEIKLNNIYLDDIRLKVDNYNKRYILTSFYSKSRQGNIEGLYTATLDRDSLHNVVSRTASFGEELRNEAKGENGMKSAFNDYFIRNLIVKKDGGFLMAAESFYTTGRPGGYNRGFMYGSPYFRSMDYYSYSPFLYSYPWSPWNSFGAMANRYHAENIAVFSFDSEGRIEWSNVIHKDQFDDDGDIFIGYQLANTGDQLHFIYNKQEKRIQLLTDQSISAEGQLTRVPTFKNLDKGYNFMPRLGKQVGSRQIIFPCMYRNYLCFARLDL